MFSHRSVPCFFIFTCVWPELDGNEMTSNLKVEEALDSEGPMSSGSGHRGRWPSCHKASHPALSPSPSVISALLSNSSTGGHLSRSFPVYCPKSGYDSLDKGGPLRPSSEHHANKYSSPCLSNVAVSHLSLLPVINFNAFRVKWLWSKHPLGRKAKLLLLRWFGIIALSVGSMVLQSIILFSLKDSQKSPLSNFVWCDSEFFLNKYVLLKEALLWCGRRWIIKTR